MPDTFISSTAADALFRSYISAASAYRIVILRTTKLLLDEYGKDQVLRFYDATSVNQLADIYDNAFLTRVLISHFVTQNRTVGGTNIVKNMYEGLKKNSSINEFKEQLKRAGYEKYSSDVYFYLEYRFKLIRNAHRTESYENPDINKPHLGEEKMYA